MNKKIIELLIWMFKCCFFISLFFSAYYITTPKFEFTKTNIRKNKVTGTIEFYDESTNYEWKDLVEEDRNSFKEEKEKLTLDEKKLSIDMFVDYDPDLKN